MAAPNLIGATTILGKTTAANLTSTSATTVLSNASGSGKVLKVNTLNASNWTNSSANVSVVWNNASSLGGTSYNITSNLVIPAGSTLTVVDKSTQYYLEENQSIGAIAGTANAINITLSYEDIS
jgi:hypothetical protein